MVARLIENVAELIREEMDENHQAKSFEGLFEKQKAYLLENKELLFGEYRDKKIGFDFNIPVYLSNLIHFELRKVFSVVDTEIHTDNFLETHFKDILDALWVQQGDDFSLKEAMKTEVRLTLITRYAMSIRKEKVYPSQVKRKEKVINNAVKKAHSVIDAYFEDRDILHSEIADVIDIFETIVFENGKHIDMHCGSYGFSLAPEKSSLDLIKYVEKERALIEERFELLQEYIYEVDNLEREISNLGLTFREDLERTLMLSDFYGNPYTLRKTDRDVLEAELMDHVSGLETLRDFLIEGKKLALPSLSASHVKVKSHSFVIGHYHFDFKEGSVTDFIREMKEYNEVKPFIERIESEFAKKESHFKAIIKQNQLNLSVRMKKNKTIGALQQNLAHTIESGAGSVTGSLSFVIDDGQLRRLTGEKVLTPDVVIYELMEQLREADEKRVLSIENARQMFLSVLSEEEEQMVVNEDVTILEGEENYYALLVTNSYNNVVKIPKELKNESQIKALCIHPANPSLPKHDGLAAIALSIKSGDEQYVLDKSNEFSVASEVKKKVMDLFNSFVPQPV